MESPTLRGGDELAGAQLAQRPGVVRDRPVGRQVARGTVAEEDVDPHDVGVGEPLPGRHLPLRRVDGHAVVGARDDDGSEHGRHEHEEHTDEQAGVAPRGAPQPGRGGGRQVGHGARLWCRPGERASRARQPVDNLAGAPACGWHTDVVARRFIPLTEVSEILDISSAQAYALVRSGYLPAIKVGGRGQWRVETVELEAYIQRMYAETRDLVTTRSERSRATRSSPPEAPDLPSPVDRTGPAPAARRAAQLRRLDAHQRDERHRRHRGDVLAATRHPLGVLGEVEVVGAHGVDGADERGATARKRAPPRSPGRARAPAARSRARTVGPCRGPRASRRRAVSVTTDASGHEQRRGRRRVRTSTQSPPRSSSTPSTRVPSTRRSRMPEPAAAARRASRVTRARSRRVRSATSSSSSRRSSAASCPSRSSKSPSHRMSTA